MAKVTKFSKFSATPIRNILQPISWVSWFSSELKFKLQLPISKWMTSFKLTMKNYKYIDWVPVYRLIRLNSFLMSEIFQAECKRQRHLHEFMDRCNTVEYVDFDYMWLIFQLFLHNSEINIDLLHLILFHLAEHWLLKDLYKLIQKNLNQEFDFLPNQRPSLISRLMWTLLRCLLKCVYKWRDLLYLPGIKDLFNSRWLYNMHCKAVKSYHVTNVFILENVLMN